MRALRRLAARLAGLLRRDRFERDMDEELGSILEHLIDGHLRAGLEPREARRRALVELGGMEQVKEAGRDAHRLRWLEDTLRDLRLALRTLLATPLFVAVAALTLALGIGVNAALFSVVYGVLLRPLALEDPSSLVVLRAVGKDRGAFPGFSASHLADLRERSSSFDGIAAWVWDNVTMREGDETEALDNVLAVTGNFFSVLGVDAILGRPLLPEDELARRRGSVAVIGEDFWRRRWGADPALLGRTLLLDEQPFVVVGVMPSGVPLPPDVRMWIPQDFDAEDRSFAGRLMPVGRLREGVEREAATAEVERLLALSSESEAGIEVSDVTLLPALESLVGETRSTLLLIVAAVGLVLLVTCANLANLLLARASVREREMAARRALGAGPLEIVRLVLTESLVLALLGAGAGLALALLAHRFVLATAMGFLPRLEAVRLDWPVVLFTIGLALLAGLLFGAAPALHALGVDVNLAMHGGGRGTVGSRAASRSRVAMLVGQIAVAATLLVCAGLLLRSLLALRTVDPGFEPRGVVAGRINLDEHTSTDAAEAAYFRRLVETLRTAPGVDAAGASSGLPFDPIALDFEVGWERPGAPTPEGKTPPTADFRAATPGYFATLAIPLLEGRDFDDLDTRESGFVSIVNRSLARRAWPGESPLDEELLLRFPGYPAPVRFRVVGVVGDVRSHGLRSEPRPEVFVAQEQVPLSSMTVVVRGSLDTDALIRTLHRAASEVDRGQAVERALPVASLLSDSLARDRFAAVVLGLFAAIAVLLATSGLYGVIAYWVDQSRKEIGLRLALGAARSQVMGEVIRRGLLVTALGLLLGVCGALAVSRLLGNLLFGVGVLDPLVLGAVSLLLGSVALTASFVPAQRASRLDPVTALRLD